jgi:hypothetical protein
MFTAKYFPKAGKKTVVSLLCVGALAGCLENDIQRAGAGALTGAVLADITGGSVATGAAIGAAGGALCDDARLC